MGLGDKIQEGVGKAKEALGDATDKPGLEAEGHQDQAEAKADEAQRQRVRGSARREQRHQVRQLSSSLSR